MHVSSGPSLQRRPDPPYLSVGPPRSPIGPPVTPSDPLLLPYTPLASSRGLTLHSAGRRVASEEGDVAVVHQDQDQDGGGDPPHQALPFWTPALGLQAPWRGRLCHSASHPAGEGEGGYGGESSAWHRIVRCHIFDRDQNKAAVSERYLGRVSHRQFQFGNVCCARVCLQLYIHLFRYSLARNVQSFQQRLPFKFWKRREFSFPNKQADIAIKIPDTCVHVSLHLFNWCCRNMERRKQSQLGTSSPNCKTDTSRFFVQSKNQDIYVLLAY